MTKMAPTYPAVVAVVERIAVKSAFKFASGHHQWLCAAIMNMNRVHRSVNYCRYYMEERPSSFFEIFVDITT